jgi:2-keto-3-deoxy-6-phosphogluconate aldolase
MLDSVNSFPASRLSGVLHQRSRSLLPYTMRLMASRSVRSKKRCKFIALEVTHMEECVRIAEDFAAQDYAKPVSLILYSGTN